MLSFILPYEGKSVHTHFPPTFEHPIANIASRMYNMAGDAMFVPILFCDDSLVVCLKPPGADSEREMPSLLSAQLGAAEVFCVHRLDRAVGGVMVYALNKEAAAGLSRQMAGGTFWKEYLAVVHGRPEADAGTLRDLLYYDRAHGKSYVVTRKRAGVKEASLSYRLLGEADGFSLLAVRLHTGRTHQIRVQFASRRMPLAGDGRYGSPRRNCPLALWSRALGFAHPASSEAMHFEALPPDDYPWNQFLLTGDLTCDTLK